MERNKVIKILEGIEKSIYLYDDEAEAVREAMKDVRRVQKLKKLISEYE